MHVDVLMPRDKKGRELAFISFRSAVCMLHIFVFKIISGHRAGERTSCGPSSTSKPGPSPAPPAPQGGDWVLYQILVIETWPKGFISLVFISFRF